MSHMMHFSTTAPSRAQTLSDLQATLLSLHQSPYPHVPNPPGCKKRASVACILRIRPTYPDVADYAPPASSPTTSSSSPRSQSDPALHSPKFPSDLESFWSNPSAARGTPEVLFIKRAARPGDRFTSHVAFPGGKRDPEDSSDLATAIRETSEEIGLDLTDPSVLCAGNLPERIVTAEWGRTPLMVLSPFVFVLTDFERGGGLRLQPSEVGSAHWVPLAGLMSGEGNCYERAEVSDRLAGRRHPVVRGLLRVWLGQMLFAATKLVPVESLYSDGGTTVKRNEGGIFSGVSKLLFGDHAGSSDPRRQLKLWGLTYGIVADFLDLLPNHDLKKTWTWPTVSMWDMRALVWLWTFRHRQERMKAARPLSHTPPIIVDEGVGTLAGWKEQLPEERARIEREMRIARASSVDHMLKGYFELFRSGVIMALVVRSVVGVSLGVYLVKQYKRRKQSRL